MKKQLEGIKILVVDDEALLVEAISENLTFYGATVYCAMNGLEAMEILRTNSVDFVLSDMRMPKSDGIDFLKKLRSTYPTPPPFFFLTGYAEAYSVDTLKELGASDVISKPFSIKQIVELITNNVVKQP